MVASRVAVLIQQNSVALIHSAGCRWARRGVHAGGVGGVLPRPATGVGLGLQQQVVFGRWGGLPVSRLMRGDIYSLLSAACMSAGRSLQACRAAQGGSFSYFMA
ncbi:hypothetical protein D3C81_778430 [compost metagenome]